MVLSKNDINLKPIHEGNLNEFPKGYQKAFRTAKAILDGKIFTPKQITLLKNDLKKELDILFIINPDLQIREVVLALLKILPEKIPAKHLLEMTSFITENWEAKKQKLELV